MASPRRRVAACRESHSPDLACAVVGSHTHVPTADAMILPGGTAYMTDAGMCGDYNSVIGMEKDEPMPRVTNSPSTSSRAAATGGLCRPLVTLSTRMGT